MTIAILSTLISSIALIGVVISLLLQARQLRTNQVQVTRAAQQELIKFSLENPGLTTEVLGINDPDAYMRHVYLNWYLSYLSMTYNIRTMSKPNLRLLLREPFTTEASREWWEMERQGYRDWAISRRDKEFVAIVEEEFQRASQVTEAPETGTTPPDRPINSSPPRPS